MRAKPPKKKAAGEPSAAETAQKTPRDGFWIAAIGASAGGVEAFGELIKHLASDTGMAFVLIQHLDPKHHSMLTELISKQTAMAVREVTDGMKVEPNTVYVIPPNTTMSIADRTLQLSPRAELQVLHMSIDHFMRSLAADVGNRAIGVILSGTGTDGTLGMAEIQAEGGVTLAQSEDSAKYDGMPHSAAAAGCVDSILPPQEIARELGRIAHHPYAERGREPEKPGKSEASYSEASYKDGAGLAIIFNLLRRSTGLDFSNYRQSTILRRIHRRMMVHKIEKLEDYVRYVQTNPTEIRALYQDMLINVTSFFRNRAVFEAMKTEVFPKVLKSRNPDSAIRIWTPGCSTGEETYSVAIALLEFLAGKREPAQLQFFGTDVSEGAIAKARAGVYPENIRGDVSPERLRTFFTQVDSRYRINKSIRDMCIFARHNILNDPPFSQIDVICCRNLLIYLEPALQSKAISLFHYAIRPGGFLVLGTSEGVGAQTSLFANEDRVQKIFSKKGSSERQLVTFTLERRAEHESRPALNVPGKQQEPAWSQLEAQKEFDRRLLGQYVPAAVFINEELEIVHTRGNVTRYLKLAPGRASLNILKMAREGLLLEMRNAINRAKKEEVSVRKTNAQMKSSGNGNGNGKTSHASDAIQNVNIEVSPVSVGTLKESYFMIIFQDTPAQPRRPSRAKGAKEAESTTRQVVKLEQELDAAKEYLQSVIETQEATNEELQSANEDILSSNEELQSTNEEMETAKEELQSTNEELSTVNDELRARNLEVTQINNDLTTLLSAIDTAVVLVASDLSIRRFTPSAQKIFGLIPADIGRSLANIKPNVYLPDLQPMITEAISQSRPVQRTYGSDGERYHLQVSPYFSLDGRKMEGVVLTVQTGARLGEMTKPE